MFEPEAVAVEGVELGEPLLGALFEGLAGLALAGLFELVLLVSCLGLGLSLGGLLDLVLVAEFGDEGVGGGDR